MTTPIGAALLVSCTVIVIVAFLYTCTNLTCLYSWAEARFGWGFLTLTDLTAIWSLSPAKLTVHSAHYRLAH